MAFEIQMRMRARMVKLGYTIPARRRGGLRYSGQGHQGFEIEKASGDAEAGPGSHGRLPEAWASNRSGVARYELHSPELRLLAQVECRLQGTDRSPPRPSQGRCSR